MADDPWAQFNPQPASPAPSAPKAEAADPWAQFNPQPADTHAQAPHPQKEDRNILQRMGDAAGETFEEGVNALGRRLSRSATDNVLDVVDPFGATRAAMKHFTEPKKIPGAVMGHVAENLSPVTTVLGPPISAVESAASTVLGEQERARKKLIAKGVGLVAPETGKKMESEVPSSEEAYEGWRPIVGVGSMLLGLPLAKVGKAARTVLTKTPEGIAGRFIEERATDLPAVKQKLENLKQNNQEIVPGSEPTAYGVLDDQGLGQVEAGAMRRPGMVEKFKEKQAAQNSARQRMFEDVAPQGSPTAVSEHLRDTMRAETRAGDEMAEAAARRAWEETQALGGQADQTTYGNVLRRGLEASEQRVRANESARWRAIDPTGTLRANPQPLQVVERNIYAPTNLSASAASGMTADERRLSALAQGFQPQGIPLQEILDFRSEVSTALRHELYTQGQTPAYARLSRLRGGIEDALTESFGGPGSGVAERLQAATTATRERAAQFRPTRALTRKESASGPYKLEEVSTIPDKVIAQGAKGYDTVSNYLRAAGNEYLPELTDAIAAKYRREVISPEGVVNPRKHEGFLRRYQDVLRAIDERDGGAFSQRLRNIGTAQETAEAAITRQSNIARQQANDQFARLAGAVDDADATRMIGNIFGKQDSVGRARELASRLTTPEARAGAQNAVARYMRERLVSNAQLGEDPLISADKFQTFIKTNRDALLQILEPKQVANLQRIAQDLQRSAKAQQLKVTGDSGTHQFGMAQKATDTALQAGTKKAMSIGWKAALDVAAGHIPIIGPLAVRGLEAARGARAAQKEAALTEQVQRLIDEAMLDPKKLGALLNKVREVIHGPNELQKAGIAVGTTAPIGTFVTQEQGPRATGGNVPTRGSVGVLSPGKTTAAGGRETRPQQSEALSDGGTTGDGQASAPVGYSSGLGQALSGSWSAGSPWSAATARETRKIRTGQAPKGMSRSDIVDVLKAQGLASEAKSWQLPAQEAKRGGKVIKLLASGGDVDAEPDEAAEAEKARAVAAERVRRGVIPSTPGGFQTGRRQEGQLQPALAEALLPSTPLEAGLAVALGPFGRLAKVGALAGGAALQGSDAEAGKLKLLTSKGLPQAGKDFTKAAREAADEVAAGPKGAGPLDLSSQGRISNVPQTELERTVPPRGVSPRMQEAAENPAVRKGVTESIARGKELGADRWYHTGALRDAFVQAYGPEEGARRMALYMDMVAATSPRSDVSTNIRNASYYYQHGLAGRPLPEKLPYPYGHVAQNLHRQNYEGLMAPRPAPLSAGTPGTATGWDIFANPKPASFSQNLQGNLMPVTVDTHAFRNIGMNARDPRFLGTSITSLAEKSVLDNPASQAMRFGEIGGEKAGKVKVTYRPQELYKSGRLSMDEALDIPSFWASQPNPNEYAAAERLYRELGAKSGLAPADAQAAAWSGAGPLTGLGSPPSHTFSELFNERVLYTSKIRGEKPIDTLRYFMEGKKPLFSLAGAPVAIQGLREQRQQ